MRKSTLLVGLQFLLLASVALGESRGAVDSPAIDAGAKADQGGGIA